MKGNREIRQHVEPGERFGQWTVVRYVKDGYYACLCSCGVERRVSGTNLRNGRSMSCGSQKCSPGRFIDRRFRGQDEQLRAEEIARLIKLCRRRGMDPDATVDVVYRRFGALSQREIADALGMSRQRVQQIECRALEKMRKCPNAEQLLREMVG